MESKFSSDIIKKVQEYVEKQFDTSILPSLMDYVRIPNLSRAYDAEYQTNGLLQKAANFLIDWVKQQNVKGLKIELHDDPGKTPLIFAEIDGSSANTETILLYGHFDKQPHMTGWKDGTSPINPVIIGDKLYGRGAADDGYAIYNSVMSIKALQDFGLPHPRCVILIEGDEESSSQDLPYYFNKLQERIGNPAILICMDSGCGNYEQLWLTSTLRGMLGMDIKVKIIEEGVHSGDASGIVADTFRILRTLLERIENLETGEVIKDLHVNIPEERMVQAESVAKVIGKDLIKKFPWVPTAQPVVQDELQCYLNRVWRPTLVVTGMNDIPPTKIAGNVVRPETTCRISVRLPPTLDSSKAVETVKKLITENPPYGAEVTVSKVVSSNGWNAPANQQYLDDILTKSSHNFFGKESLYFGEGVSIPFLNFLGNRFPQAQFIVTGVLGPHSNAHGPNETLDIPFTKKLLCCMVQAIGELTPHLEKH